MIKLIMYLYKNVTSTKYALKKCLYLKTITTIAKLLTIQGAWLVDIALSVYS